MSQTKQPNEEKLEPSHLWADVILTMQLIHLYDQQRGSGSQSEFGSRRYAILQNFAKSMKVLRVKEQRFQADKIKFEYLERLVPIYADFNEGNLSEEQYEKSISAIFHPKYEPKSFKLAKVTKIKIREQGGPVQTAAFVGTKIFGWSEKTYFNKKEKHAWTRQRAKELDERADTLGRDRYLGFVILKEIFGLNEADANEIFEALKPKLDPLTCPIYQHYNFAYYTDGERFKDQRQLDQTSRGRNFLSKSPVNHELFKPNS